MKLSIIIVNYNVKYYLDQCLRSVVKAIKVMQEEDSVWDAEVIVVDNHSSDGSIEYLSKRYPREHYPMVRFVGSMHNLGFARANNIAIRQSEGEYVLLLNPDTILGEHVLLESIRLLDSQVDAGAVGVRMLNAKGVRAMESRRGLPTPLVAFYKMMGFCNRWPEHRVFGRYYMGYLPWDKVCQIEVVSGAYCMLRREAIDKVGLLDEDFFMYGEDIDLSYRVLKGGFHNYYIPSLILHYKGESTQKSSFHYVHVFYEAMLIFFRKHNSGMSLLLTIPINLAIYAKASIALVHMMTSKIRKSLGFVAPRHLSYPSYLFIGSGEMLGECRELSEKAGLESQFVCGDEYTIPEGHLSAQVLSMLDKMSGDVNIVYDVHSYSYDQIFRIFMSRPNGHWRMGTYNRDTHKLITDKEIFCN